MDHGQLVRHFGKLGEQAAKADAPNARLDFTRHTLKTGWWKSCWNEYLDLARTAMQKKKDDAAISQNALRPTVCLCRK